MNSREFNELKPYGEVLVEQARHLTTEIGCAPPRGNKTLASNDRLEALWHRVSSAHTHLTKVRQKANSVEWERAIVNGRDGDYLLDELTTIIHDLTLLRTHKKRNRTTP